MEQNIGGTADGRLWLMKALDPAGQAVDVRGMPDVENHTCAVLNYQTQTQMSAPNLYKLDPSNNITYDADLYLYQHPIIFGSGVTYPSGTVDPLTYSKNIILEFGGEQVPAQGKSSFSPSISFQTGGKPLFPRTPFVAHNEELGVQTIPEAVKVFQNVAQRHRVIYGAAQLVPTCSANDNSGSISVSQSFLNGDRSGNFVITPAGSYEEPAAVDGTYPLEYYEPGDFAEERMIMQNPKALITRFYEGSYIPYKLPNPLESNFMNTGQLTATRSPCWIIGAQISNDNANWTPLSWDYESQSFITPKDANGKPKMKSASFIRLDYLTKLGQTGHFLFADESVTVAASRLSFSVPISLQVTDLLGEGTGGALNVNSAEFKTIAITETVTTNDATAEGKLDYGTIGECPIFAYPKAPIVSSHMSGLNFRGNVKVMIRVGVELVCNAGSLYMPMVHISPAYDDAAIKNYIRVTHEMRDAFYGNAAAPEFRQQYMNNLLSVLWYPYVNVDFANRGASWTGKLAASA